jgi:hypothetical protein
VLDLLQAGWPTRVKLPASTPAHFTWVSTFGLEGGWHDFLDQIHPKILWAVINLKGYHAVRNRELSILWEGTDWLKKGIYLYFFFFFYPPKGKKELRSNWSQQICLRRQCGMSHLRFPTFGKGTDWFRSADSWGESLSTSCISQIAKHSQAITDRLCSLGEGEVCIL